MKSAPNPVVVIDVGNTSTSLGVYRAGRILRTRRLETARTSAAAALRSLTALRVPDPDGAVLASVAPQVNATWQRALRKAFPRARVTLVHHRLKLGVPVSYPKPGTIGADRLANACAAADKYGTPVIVADFGTAVTFDVIDARRGYVGGVIAPGLPLMFTYLAEKTALLPRIKPGLVRSPVGRSTKEAMRAGAVYGYRGLVREIVTELRRALGGRGVKVCATGGYAGWVLQGSGLRIPVDPDLTLYGLGRIHELNP